jgi:hypothetical protein
MKGTIMKRNYIVLGLFMLAASTTATFAQDADSTVAPSTATTEEQLTTLKGQIDGINESYLETKATVDKLAKIKVSGYIQAQYQVADVKGVLDGTNSLLRQRFAIKRGRVKTTYDAGHAKYVLELDATQDGVGVKDAYVAISEPWLKALTLTVGAQDRPFGYEVSYSSSMLESPERSKIIGYLFPKEKDLGAMVEFAQDDGPLSFLNAKVGVFNGQTNILNENDDYKDVIGRIGFKSALKDLGLAIDGGVSGYMGKVTNTDSTSGGRTYEMSGTKWVATTGQKKELVDRQYIGADMQMYYSWPVLGGTCIKGEFISGKHPTVSGKDDYYSPSVYPSTNAVYKRNISGYYAYLVQNIDPVGCQVVLKVDGFDPNTDVSADDFSSTTTTLTSGDIAYTTIGAGIIYYLKWDPNVRLQLYYDMPKNEKLDAAKITSGSLLKYTKAVNNNVLTFRVQYKF